MYAILFDRKVKADERRHTLVAFCVEALSARPILYVQRHRSGGVKIVWGGLCFLVGENGVDMRVFKINNPFEKKKHFHVDRM